MQRTATRIFEMVNELAACAQTANENSYGWIRHQEKPGRMISMGPIGHSICRNYRKPMKILFYPRLVLAYECVARVTEFRLWLRRRRRCVPFSPPGNCQPYCNIVAWIPFSLQGRCHIFFNTLIWVLLTWRYSFRMHPMELTNVETNESTLRWNSEWGEKKSISNRGVTSGN